MAGLTVARRQPMAVVLREIVGAMRTCNDIERIGDHAKHIRKVRRRVERRPVPAGAGGVEHMADLVLCLLKQVLDANALRRRSNRITTGTSSGSADSPAAIPSGGLA
jgi:phosphate transport system protein